MSVYVVAMASVLSGAPSSNTFYNSTNHCPQGPDPGDTAWVVVASVLVLGMLPGLALFEIGLLRSKNAVSVMLQVIAGIMVRSLNHCECIIFVELNVWLIISTV